MARTDTRSGPSVRFWAPAVMLPSRGTEPGRLASPASSDRPGGDRAQRVAGEVGAGGEAHQHRSGITVHEAGIGSLGLGVDVEALERERLRVPDVVDRPPEAVDGVLR